MEKNSPIFVGTAGWSIPSHSKEAFPREGSHLERYARRLTCVEINSSFYRHHEAKTYARWARSTPEGFHFSVKLFKGITHEGKLEVSSEMIRETLEPLHALEEKWGALLVQLPPKLEYVDEIAGEFFTTLRELSSVPIVVEPRHETWGSREALALMSALGISKVRASPERVSIPPEARPPVERILYYRLHGTPVMYRSPYSERRLRGLVGRLHEARGPAWAVFDNTAYGEATKNALRLKELAREFESSIGKDSRLVESLDS